AQVQLRNNVTVAENFSIRDIGVGFGLDGDGNTATLGTIRSASGTNVLRRTITLLNNASFGVDGGSILNVTGTIMMVPSAALGTTGSLPVTSTEAGFTKFGAGTLFLGGTGDNVVPGQVTVEQGTLQLNKQANPVTGLTATPFSGPLA